MRSARSIAGVFILVSLLSACAAATVPSSTIAPSPSGAAAASDPRSAAPTRSSRPRASASVEAPSPTPSVTPLPTPEAPLIAVREPADWSKPVTIADGECWSVAVTIDDRGRYHIATRCDGEIHYLRWYPDAVDTHGDVFPPPSDRVELGPQLALDGAELLMAYSRLAREDGGCGDDGLRDLGVYVRTRSDETDTWSKPYRVGEVGDSLQSFRAVDGVLHLTVQTLDGAVLYESLADGATTRVPIPRAKTTSLRVGDDGHARVAYSTGHEIRLARVDGRSIDSRVIASSDETNLSSPAMVLGPGDVPVIVWTQNVDGGGGCAGPEPGPLDGTYLATEIHGTWQSERISKSTGSTSVTLDPATGRWHAIIDEPMLGLRYITTKGDVSLSRETLPDSRGFNGAVIRIDPEDGRLAVVAASYDDGIVVATKP